METEAVLTGRALSQWGYPLEAGSVTGQNKLSEKERASGAAALIRSAGIGFRGAGESQGRIAETGWGASSESAGCSNSVPFRLPRDSEAQVIT